MYCLIFELQDNHGHFKKRIAYLIANGAGLAYQIFGEPAPSSWSWEDNPEGVDADGPHLSIGGICLEILGYQNTTEKVHQRPYVQHTGKSIPDEKNYLHPAATAVINLGEFTCQMYLDNPSLQQNIINLPSFLESCCYSRINAKRNDASACKNCPGNQSCNVCGATFSLPKC